MGVMRFLVKKALLAVVAVAARRVAGRVVRGRAGRH